MILDGLIYPVAIWSFGSLVSFLSLTLADLIGWCARLLRSRAVGARELPVAVSDPSRRRFVQVGLGAIAAAPVLISGYGASIEGIGCEVEEVWLSISGTHPFGSAQGRPASTGLSAGFDPALASP